VARLAAETGVPIVPVGLSGTDEVQPVGLRYMRPFRTVTVRFGEPLLVSSSALSEGNGSAEIEGRAGGAETSAARQVTDRLMREIARLAGRDYVDEYIPRKASRPERHGRDGSGGGELTRAEPRRTRESF
jgi:1-acyl-sn-glycerol-3-phosphate acyltransferase